MLVASAVAVARPTQTRSTASSQAAAPSAAAPTVASASTDRRLAVAQITDRLAAILRAAEMQGLGDELRPLTAQWNACIDTKKADLLREVERLSPEEAMAQIVHLQRMAAAAETALLEHRSRRNLDSARWIKYRVPVGEVLPPNVSNPNDILEETPAAAPLELGAGSEALVPGQAKNLSTVYGSDLRSVARKSVLRMCVRSHARNPRSPSTRILTMSPSAVTRASSAISAGIAIRSSSRA